MYVARRFDWVRHCRGGWQGAGSPAAGQTRASALLLVLYLCRRRRSRGLGGAMVLSEIVAATMIAVCGLKKSYRIVLRGERMARKVMYAPPRPPSAAPDRPRALL